jgi:hypothetical protein
MWTLTKKGKKVGKENLAQQVLVVLKKALTPLNIKVSRLLEFGHITQLQ